MTTSPDRIKHLEFIQNTIARQASHSFAVKGWSLTVSAAIYVYTASHLTWWLAIVAVLPAIAFSWLDAFYLRQERLFRELYSDVSQSSTAVLMFSMDTGPYAVASTYPKCTYRNVFKSNTWWVFHGMIFAVGVLLLGVAIVQMFRTTELADCIRDVF